MRLRGEEASHLCRSLRAKAGDVVSVYDGRGKVCTVRLSGLDPEVVDGELIASSEKARETPRITLFQAVAQPARMDDAVQRVQRAAEAGVLRVVPFISPRSPEGAAEKAIRRLQRWRKLGLEASKVARRAFPLEIGDPLQWPIDASLREQGLNLLLWEGESARGLRETLPAATPESVGVIVEPEGGVDEKDARAIESAGAVPVSIGALILRTKSAGAYAAMLVRYRYGLLEPGGGT